MTTKLTTSNFELTALGAITGPRITNVQVTDNTYTVLDDTAVDIAGGYIKITGTNFVAGCQVMVDMTVVSTVTFVSATEVRAQLAARAAGTYTVYVINPNGDTAVRIYGVTFSAVPAWVTGSTLTGDSGTAVSIQLDAAGASTYALAAGSTLPPGLTLSSAGLISGTVDINEETLYNFIVVATDAELQDSPRSFAITISTGDLQIKYVTALLSPELSALPFNDDASTNNFAVSVVGDTRPNSFGPYTPGYYSNFFDGTGDYLTCTTIPTFNTGDFTIEGWVYTSSVDNSGIFQLNTSAFGGTGGLALAFYTAGGGINTYYAGTTGGGNITLYPNTWYHFALSRSGTSLRVFINGALINTFTDSTNYSISTLVIGGYYSASYLLTGYVSNFRIVNGTAVYTSAFTPPSAPLTAISNTSLLTCQSNRFIDNSTNNFTITVNGNTLISSFDPFVPNSSYSTYGSGYFDGTGDYLSVPSNAVFNFDTGDFTIEAWVYPTSLASDWFIASSTGIGGLFFGYRQSSAPQGFGWGQNGVAWDYVITSGTVNTWQHVSLTRSGTSMRLFVNGVQIGTTQTIATSYNLSTTSLTIGSQGTSYYLTGYLTDVRVVKGTAVYTTAFTPPSAPLTAITNTSLLTCQTNQPNNNNVFLDSSTNNLLVTRNGNTTQGTFSPYGGGWSNYFDGSGDSLSITGNNAALGNIFTIEMWVYPLVAPSNVNYYIGGATTGPIIGYNGSTFAVARQGVWVLTSPTNPPLNTWTHIAVVREGIGTNQYKLYLNGVLMVTGTEATTFAAQTSAAIGGPNAYISNLRIVNGTALYTANFTPSTAPLQPIAGTSLLTCADNRFVDDSPNNFVITRNGDVSVQKFNPFGIQTAMTPVSHSAFFDGTGDSLTVGTAPVALPTATTPFTIEAWVYVTAFTGISIISTNYVSGGIPFMLGMNGGTNSTTSVGGYPILYFYSGSAWNYAVQSTPANSTALNLNTWYHIAGVYTGSEATIYVNGTATVTAAIAAWTTNASAAGGINIGRKWDTSTAAYFSGYISNARLVIGTAVYTANFTPATTPLTAIANTSLLTCQSPTFVDNSTNRSAITAAGDARPSQTNPFGFTAGAKTNYTPAVYGGSMYFDYNGDRLIIPYTTALSQTSPYTLEFWFYPTYNFTGQYLFARNAGGYFGLAWNGTSGIISVDKHGVGIQITATTALRLNQWHHVAMTYNGTTTRLFTNGILQGSVNGTGGESSANTTIGYYEASANSSYGGYMSDFRYVKGTAVYTSSFVPPAAPLEPITNTTLLVNGTAAAVYDASMSNNLETVGDARISTAVVKYGNTSMAFDGTGDYLEVKPINGSFAFGTGNFTIEGWYYSLAYGGNYALVGKGPSDSDDEMLILLLGGQYYVDWGSTSGAFMQGGTWSANTWNHFALVRNGANLTLYHNGVSAASVANVSSTSFADAYTLKLGVARGTSFPFNGYMSDFRVTKGVARYTATFTPPASMLRTR